MVTLCCSSNGRNLVGYVHICLRRVWRYQRGNQNPYIEEEQTTQWPKEKVQKEKQRSSKHTHKTKDRVTWTQLKTGCELGCSRRVSSPCSTSGTRRVNVVNVLRRIIFWWSAVETKTYFSLHMLKQCPKQEIYVLLV